MVGREGGGFESEEALRRVWCGYVMCERIRRTWNQEVTRSGWWWWWATDWMMRRELLRAV